MQNAALQKRAYVSLESTNTYDTVQTRAFYALKKQYYILFLLKHTFAAQGCEPLPTCCIIKQKHFDI